MRGEAPPHNNNLIGKAARGWTQIGPFKMDTTALFISLAFTSSSLLAGTSGSSFDRARSPPLPSG